MTNAPAPPLADPEALVAEMSKVHRRMAADLLARSSDPRILPALRAEHEEDRRAGRTGEGFEDYRRGYCDQVAASWVLCAVFARTLEDRGYVPHRIAGPGAGDRFTQFRAMFRFLGARDYLAHLFDAMAQLPGGQAVFGRDRAPLWKLGPSGASVNDLLEALRATERGELRFSFGRPQGADHDGASTRYLGDLYQDLNEDVRKRYALLQTPEFVERFLLDHTLDPAIRERGYAVTVLDPACGSGHLLLGAYDRLFEARREREPGLPEAESARSALRQVFGVDLNPYAAAVARFRLLLSYLDKARIPRLESAPEDLEIQVYVGDSLLAGREYQATVGDLFAEKGILPEVSGLEKSREGSFYDRETADLLSRTRFDVVVANPPYITEKDPVKREKIRDKYVAAAGKFALSAPFVERIFQLANDGGYTGQITANSFMKREFGKKLVEEVLPKVDLTEVIDTSGAYIPGHGTPTVILFGRAQQPIARHLRVVMGSRGEPATPEKPEEGKVWGAIAGHHLDESYSDEFITVAEVERGKLAKHPWSIGGGGAAELKELLEERAEKRLGDIADEAGFGAVIGENEVYTVPASRANVPGVPRNVLVPVVGGETVRDWSIVPEPAVLVMMPYVPNGVAVRAELGSCYHTLWLFRTQLWIRRGKGFKTILERGGEFYEYCMFYHHRYFAALRISFAFVATHNHFALEHGEKVFRQSAPLIKLPDGATEEDYLALVGFLNSSMACFWMKEVMMDKGGSGIGRGIQPEDWMARYEFSGFNLQDLPVPAEHRSLLPYAKELDDLAAKRQQATPQRAVEEAAAEELRAVLQAHAHTDAALLARMIAVQEELDWAVYELVGLPSVRAGTSPSDTPPHPRLRAFEVLMLREQVKTAWFERHARVTDEKLVRMQSDPDGWDLLEKRIAAIQSNPMLRLLEAPDYKRRWEPFDWPAAVQQACESWLLDRLETTLRDQPTRRPQPIRALAHTLQADPKVRAVAEVLTGGSTFDLEAVLADLVQKEAVPSATCQRYTDIGIEKRRAWEKTWELQRREDAGESVKIEVPPKYDQKDFENAAVLWRLRGKLDVPKERFIAYPTATPPPGTSGKAAFTVGWAGWNALEQLEATIVLWQEEVGLHGHLLMSRSARAERAESLGPAAATDERLQKDAAARERLLPLLQTMVDLLPWVAQWHDEDGQTARDFGDYLSEQARVLEVSLDEAHAYRRPRKADRARPAPKRAASAAAPSAADPTALLDAVRDLDDGGGAPVSALADRLGLSAAALKKAVDALVESHQLIERKKRPRLVSAA